MVHLLESWNFWLTCSSLLSLKFASKLKLIQSAVGFSCWSQDARSLWVLVSGFWFSGSQILTPGSSIPGSQVLGLTSQGLVSRASGPRSLGFQVSGSQVSGPWVSGPGSQVPGSWVPGPDFRLSPKFSLWKTQ